MIRSSRFGSIRSDLTPCSDSLSLGLRRFFLNPATSYKSPAHSSTGTLSDIMYPPTACQLTVSCSFSLPYGGSISPFHRCTSSLSVTQEYLALRGGPRRFTRDSTCPMLLGIFSNFETVDYWTFTIYGAGFSCFVFFLATYPSPCLALPEGLGIGLG